MEQKGRVEQRREEAIQRAAITRKWGKVDNLLNQHYENLCRKDRFYSLCSLDSSSDDTDSLLEMVADNRDPLTILVQKEEIAIMNEAIERMWSNRDKEILSGVVLENKPFSHLAKEVGLSDKTVKSHYERIIQSLRKELKDL